MVVGFNGEFLARLIASQPVRLEWYGAGPCRGRVGAGPLRGDVQRVRGRCGGQRATQAGFNVVMLADEQAAYADLVRRVAGVVSLAHPRAVAVEAELGSLAVGQRVGRARRQLLDRSRPGGPVRRTFQAWTFWPLAPATSILCSAGDAT